MASYEDLSLLDIGYDDWEDLGEAFKVENGKLRRPNQDIGELGVPGEG